MRSTYPSGVRSLQETVGAYRRATGEERCAKQRKLGCDKVRLSGPRKGGRQAESIIYQACIRHARLDLFAFPRFVLDILIRSDGARLLEARGIRLFGFVENTFTVAFDVVGASAPAGFRSGEAGSVYLEILFAGRDRSRDAQFNMQSF